MSIDNNMNATMARMQALAALAQGQAKPADDNLAGGAAAGSAGNGVDFGEVLRQAVQNVSDAQNSAQAKAQAFQMGDKDMSLEEVMVSLQKANLAFQGMIAVRNRLVEAYKEVTNLQV
jgi:flagellar hook-basal body complex protein FliE